jgi:hypothetical protein
MTLDSIVSLVVTAGVARVPDVRAAEAGEVLIMLIFRLKAEATCVSRMTRVCRG